MHRQASAAVRRVAVVHGHTTKFFPPSVQLARAAGASAAPLVAAATQHRSFASGPHFEGFFGGGFPGGGFQQAPRGNSERFYQLLGVDRSASDDEIKRAYKKLAMKHHPDRGGDEATFKDITKAYSVLSTPDKRAFYDQNGEEALDNMEQGQGGPGQGADPFDLFSQIFGFNAGRQPRGRPRTADSTYELQVTLEELYSGTTREIVFNRDAVCRACDGHGGLDVRQCTSCNGTGVQVTMHQMGPFMQQMQSKCGRCAGKGFIIPPGNECKTCRSRGTVKEKNTFSVEVEKGFLDGHEFRFRGKADEAPGHDPGDVVILIRQKPHKVFHRSKNALVMTKTISLSEALCGFQFSTTFLDGEELTVRSTPGKVVKPGDMMIIEGKGMRTPHGKAGDLHLILEVDFPKEMPLESHSKLLEVLGGESIPEDAAGTEEARQLSPQQSKRIKQRLAEEASQERRGRGGGGGVECAQQ